MFSQNNKTKLFHVVTWIAVLQLYGCFDYSNTDEPYCHDGISSICIGDTQVTCLNNEVSDQQTCTQGCDTTTGKCAPSSSANNYCNIYGCANGYFCNTKTGICSPTQTDSCQTTGCPSNYYCNQKTGSCEKETCVQT